MKAVGIVSEYNPFHLGHLRHLQMVREHFGEETVIVCALSGDFVQRGEPAVFSKAARAEMAVCCGADLVAELPAVWSLQSAEGFSDAALSILCKLGVSALSCGAEDPEDILPVAEALLSKGFEQRLRLHLCENPGESYAAEREAVLRELIGDQAAILRRPNDILAVEYARTIRRKGYAMDFLPVQRTGAGHDASSEGTVRSALDLRGRLENGEDIAPFIPEPAAAVIRRETEAGRGPVLPKNLEQAFLALLRAKNEKDFLTVSDCDAALAARITGALRRSAFLDEVYTAAATKRYTLARVRRVCTCAAMGIPQELQREEPPYLRVLAANERGRRWLKELGKAEPELPLLTKPADAPTLGEKPAEAMALSSRIHDLVALAYRDGADRVCGMDYRISPRIL